MKEYIEREAVLIYAKMLVHTAYERKEKITDEEIEKLVYGIHADFTGAELGAIPASDVVEVRHGWWIDSEEDGHPSICCVCNYPVDRFFKTKFCPNCGAEMTEVRNDE